MYTGGVYKHVIVVEILAETPDLSGWSLADLGREMDYGEFMGVSQVKEVRELTTRMEVFDEAEAMGGEGEFFIHDEEEEYA